MQRAVAIVAGLCTIAAFAINYLKIDFVVPRVGLLAVGLTSAVITGCALRRLLRSRKVAFLFRDKEVVYSLTVLNRAGDALVQRRCTTSVQAGEGVRRHNAYGDSEMAEEDLDLRAWNADGASLPVSILSRKSAHLQFDIDLGSRAQDALVYYYSYRWNGLFANDSYWFEMGDTAEKHVIRLITPRTAAVSDAVACEVLRDGSRHPLRLRQQARGQQNGNAFISWECRKGQPNSYVRFEWKLVWLRP